MGTRRSRHNRGRKPLYKDHRLVARDIIARPMYKGGAWFNSRTWWSGVDTFKLEVLCDADMDIEQSADALGRPPKSLAWKARDSGLTLPTPWARLIAPKRKPSLRLPVESQLAYPYIRSARPAHADILEVVAIIPKSLPDNVRADICQEIMIAILEGRTTLETLRVRSRSSAYFIRKFYRDNFEQDGQALSFSALDDGDAFNEAASSLAAKEWRQNAMNDVQSARDAMLKTYSAPVQIEAVWMDQVGRTQMKLHEAEQFLSFDEVAEILDDSSDVMSDP